jgi:hypothetical protein
MKAIPEKGRDATREGRAHGLHGWNFLDRSSVLALSHSERKGFSPDATRRVCGLHDLSGRVRYPARWGGESASITSTASTSPQLMNHREGVSRKRSPCHGGPTRKDDRVREDRPGRPTSSGGAVAVLWRSLSVTCILRQFPPQTRRLVAGRSRKPPESGVSR